MASCLVLPQNTCDCHFHVFGAEKEYPFSAKRAYSPLEAPLERYIERIAKLGVTRHVLVQPSVYGTDNSLHLECLKQLGANARAVVVLDGGSNESDINRLHNLGVRAMRLNMLFPGAPEVSSLSHLFPQLKRLNWHLQLLMDISLLPEYWPRLKSTGLPLVFDHFGHFQIGKKVGESGLGQLLELVRDGIAWVKLSAPYRMQLGGYPYSKLRSYVERLVEANPDRLLWGSDWPHPQAPEQPETLAATIEVLNSWLQSSELIERVYSKNAEVLYGF